MTVTYSPVNVGSTVTLTCTVELSPAVDVSVTVNTVWTGPAGFSTTNTAQAMAGNTTTYTSTAMVSSFGRAQSGYYNCTATVSCSFLFISGTSSRSGTAKVTISECYCPELLFIKDRVMSFYNSCCLICFYHDSDLSLVIFTFVEFKIPSVMTVYFVYSSYFSSCQC